MNNIIKLSAVVCAITATQWGLAQEAPTVQLEDTTLIGESVPRDAVIDMYSFEDLDAMQAKDLEDVVRYLPGITISQGDDRWGESGFNIRGLDEDRVAINVDGVPQGETLKYETGQAYGYFKGSRNGVDIEALKSVEIVKGADSIFSGSGALAGAVNFATKDPGDFFRYNDDDYYFGLKTSYASVNNEMMGTVTLANRSGSLETLAIVTKRDASEHENYDMDGADIEGSAREIPDPQDITTDSVLLKANYLVSDTQKLGLVYTLYEQDRYTNTMSYNGGWYSNRRGDDTRETNRVGLVYELASANALFDTFEAKLNKQSIDFSARTLQHVSFDFGPTFRSDEDRVSTRAFNQDVAQLQLDFTKEFGSDAMYHRFVYGFEYLDKDFENYQLRLSNSALDDAGWVESNIGALIPAADAKTYTLYGRDAIEFGESTRLRLGGRLDDITYNAYSDDNYKDGTGTLGEANFDSFTWAAGFERNLSERLVASIGVSTGFRAPTIEERYSTSGDIDDWNTVANPDLGSESSTNLDFAIAGNFDLGSFRIGYFNSDYEDFVDYVQTEGVNPNRPAADPMDPDGYFVPSNVGEVSIDGFELSGRLDASEAFGWNQRGYGASFRAAYTEGEGADGDPLYTIQPYSFSVGLSYLQPKGVWGANLYTTYTSGKDGDDAYVTEEDGTRTYPLFLSNSAAIVDLSVFYNIAENLRVSAGIYNLTDKEYYRWDSVRFIDLGDFRPGIGVSGDGIKRYSEPGRNAKLSVSYHF